LASNLAPDTSWARRPHNDSLLIGNQRRGATLDKDWAPKSRL